MLTYKKLQQKPQNFINLTGISSDRFEELLEMAKSVWAKGEQKRLTRSNRQRAVGGGRSYSLSLQDQLLMTLMGRHLSLTTAALGLLFGVNKSTASRNTRRMAMVLTQLDAAEWPETPKRGRRKNLEQALKAYPDLQSIVEETKADTPSIEPPRRPLTPGQLIAQTPPFQGLSTSERDAVSQSARLHNVERHGFFYYQGDPSTTFYILIQGQVRLSEVTPEGHQVLVRFVSPGEALGIIAVLKNTVYPLAAQAVETCQALAWDSTTLQGLMEQIPRIAINGIRLVSQRWHEVEERYRELATERVERRVAQTLLRLVRQVGQKVDKGILIDLPLTRQDLAEMTGTTHYTVSRILSRWEQENLVETGRGRVLICYPHGLTRIAEDLPLEDTGI